MRESLRLVLVSKKANHEKGLAHVNEILYLSQFRAKHDESSRSHLTEAGGPRRLKAEIAALT